MRAHQTVHASGGFVGRAPDVIEDGASFTASVTNHSDDNPLTLSAVIVSGQGDDVISSGSVAVGQGETAQVSFNIAENEIDTPEGDYTLSITAEPTLNNDWSTQIAATTVTVVREGDSGGNGGTGGGDDISPTMQGAMVLGAVGVAYWLATR